MLRKAEQFRREAVRPKSKAKKPAKPKQWEGVDTAKPGISATNAKRGLGHTAPRNKSQHADRKAAVVLEDSATGRPSRKSSRKSSNRIKADANLHSRQTRRSTSAKSRAGRGK